MWRGLETWQGSPAGAPVLDPTAIIEIAIAGLNCARALARRMSQHVASDDDTVRVSARVSRDDRKPVSAASTRASPTCSPSYKRSPSGDNSSARVKRRKSFVPSLASSVWILWLTAPWVIISSAAAFVKLRWRAADSNTRNASREIFLVTIASSISEANVYLRRSAL